MNELREVIVEYTDEQLRQEYFHNSGAYTSEAQQVMKEEVERRGLTKTSGGEAAGAQGETIELDTKDFLRFDHSFSRVDLLLASNILRDQNIPFFPDNPPSTSTFPLESESEAQYTIRVHRQYVEKAEELLDEHFIKDVNRYRLRYTGARERLKVFNFHDVAGEALPGELDVSFTEEERRLIMTLGKRLLGEADAIEKKQERVLFYYDSIGPLIERLQDPQVRQTRADLLAIIEILQVYVDELPASMDEAIEGLLSFFLQE